MGLRPNLPRLLSRDLSVIFFFLPPGPFKSSSRLELLIEVFFGCAGWEWVIHLFLAKRLGCFEKRLTATQQDIVVEVWGYTANR